MQALLQGLWRIDREFTRSSQGLRRYRPRKTLPSPEFRGRLQSRQSNRRYFVGLGPAGQPPKGHNHSRFLPRLTNLAAQPRQRRFPDKHNIKFPRRLILRNYYIVSFSKGGSGASAPGPRVGGEKTRTHYQIRA